MPKRLLRYALRYALSKLELLDTEALDLDNLDLAIGMNSVFEFRDVGIRLKVWPRDVVPHMEHKLGYWLTHPFFVQKLERLLKLPSSFKLRKAKVLQLRVTVPIDVYTSPITIEIDGVDVRLCVSGEADGRASSRQSGTPGGTEVLPNTADLAASFLEHQPDLEKKELEEALQAETQDLGASMSVSDDGSEDEGSFGTGQPLSLPTFLADFLQGIVDRMQVKIRTVTFQLDVEIPVEQTLAAAETVTFQIALEGINVEGRTVQEFGEDGAPLIVPREGKRHISLSNVRAYLVSEANVFSAFARSPSIASPAVSRSPAQSDRSQLSRQGSSLGENFDSYLAESGQFGSQQYPMGDSEAALGIPYDFSSQQEDEDGEDSPATPRASIFQDYSRPPDLPRSQSEPLDIEDVEEEDPPWASFQQGSTSAPALRETSGSGVLSGRPHTPELSPSPIRNEGAVSENDDDLTQSHIYTHEEAASMYASALSEFPQAPSQRSMPGAWDLSPEGSPKLVKGSSPRPSVQDTGSPGGLAEENIPEIAIPPPEQAIQEPEVEDEPQGPPEVEEPEKEHQESPPQDETPRGPTRLVKEIVSLKNISIYTPSHHKHIHVHPTSPESEFTYGLASSTARRVPGAFSVHSAHEQMPSRGSPAPTPAPQPAQKTDDSIEVLLSPIEVRFDASLAFLLATVASKLLEALKTNEQRSSSAAAASTGKQSDTEPSIPEIKLVAESISFLFLHHLMGVADTPERIFNPSAFDFDHEVLLRADIRNLTVSTKKEPGSPSATTTLINVGKFRFGYANGNILSFDRIDKMAASTTRDRFPAEGADISIQLLSGKGLSKADIKTLALLVQVDLQRLDETFGWFGGLSSFLNMGASMTSSTSPSTRTLPPKPKGVRFETPINPDDRSAASENKVDLRIGGLNVRLMGKECDVLLETSAFKMISRNQGIGIGITAASISGPYLKNRGPVPPIRVDIEGTRIEYHFVPEEQDLEKLLKLITPSKAQADLEDDELMVDTLLRQRRKGGVLRLTLDMVRVRAGDLHQLYCLPTLGDEVARLATVAKYLPEDDRPGLLCLGRPNTSSSQPILVARLVCLLQT